jgi:23S rRNA (adenine2503-C2)-methyltransferase
MSVKDLRLITPENLEQLLKKNKFPKYRSKQIHNWARKINVQSFNQMSNLPSDLIHFLIENFKLNKSKVKTSKKSSDGTIKFAIQLYDNLIVEAVLIPSNKRITACISSQVGCSLDCNFCATSKIKKMRNLESYEIFDQIMLLNKKSINLFSSPITNIVFMGMGEPLLNYKNVIESIDQITSDFGIGISYKKITLSTSGISKMIRKMADDNVKFNLAISLHTALEKTRNKVMPFSKSFPIKELVDSLEYWYKKIKRKITFEYLIWKEINDDFEHINALVSICKRIPSKVNIIEYNDTDNSIFRNADDKWINNYVTTLKENRIPVSVRRSRGKDIDAACGQLANKY